jgi:hypothetical protein
VPLAPSLGAHVAFVGLLGRCVQSGGRGQRGAGTCGVRVCARMCEIMHARAGLWIGAHSSGTWCDRTTHQPTRGPQPDRGTAA